MTLDKHRRCPRCGGNLFLYNGLDGWYEQCLQCSHILYFDALYENKAKVGPETASEINQGTGKNVN
jgi:ribosomal protein S27AE